jgi:hypothetical protein
MMSNDEYQQQQFWKNKPKKEVKEKTPCPTVEKLIKEKNDKTTRSTKR